MTTPPRPNDREDDDRDRRTVRDGITSEERYRIPEDPALEALEERLRPPRADQLALFVTTSKGELTASPGALPPLEATSSLTLARAWYRRELEQARRPKNTISAYTNDLAVLEHLIGSRSINAITRRDIARYLGDANSRTTRKRRLTSVRRFFDYLIETARVLNEDPTDGYYPHGIQLRSPVPLFPDEQERLLAAAAADEPWSETAVWLMMRLGLTRAELLALERDHIDRTTEPAPTVYVFYADATKRGKERHLMTSPAFAEVLDRFIEARNPRGRLFPVGPQAVNGMVERLREAAGIDKEVTPNVLRHTFAVDQARQGADQKQLLALLGLADDPRNRASVNRYLKLAEPPVNAADPSSAESASDSDVSPANDGGE
ncbi:MAG TPA: tyrosine-type recombinase/integrase [Thermomicrobiales bacterium]|nr:tyrosine-type recombinase/integrase [Thermomicrobiales bacterium]